MAGSSAHSRQLAALFDETVRLYLRLSALSTRIHGGGQLSGPRRTVLVGLARGGAQTVAQMARARAQSRQRFQPLVKCLAARRPRARRAERGAQAVAPDRIDGARPESRGAHSRHRVARTRACRRADFRSQPGAQRRRIASD